MLPGSPNKLSVQFASVIHVMQVVQDRSAVIRMPISQKKNWKVPSKIIGGHPHWSEKNLSGL